MIKLMKQKDFMKRAQSRGDSGFARVLTILALMLTMATGAWSQEWTNLVINSDMEGDDVSCFYLSETAAGGPYYARISDGVGKDGSRGSDTVHRRNT